jgi:transcriptional regulator with XRE-family HTH domain
MVRNKFGDKLRLVRERKGKTLKDVAAQIGTSESLISQIERNRVSPSIDTLVSIAEVLEVDLEYLFRDFKKKKQVSLVPGNGGGNSLTLGDVIYRELSQGFDPSELPIEVLLLTIRSGGEKGDREYGHPGREFGYLLSGEGELLYGGETYTLKAGDSISFPSDIPHVLNSRGTEDLTAVWIISPPRIFQSTREKAYGKNSSGKNL